MIATHAITMNGDFTGEFKPGSGSAEDELRGILSRMDGTDIFAVCLWALPPGKQLDDVVPRRTAEYIQCAGVADRMTVETRSLRDGHFVIGRPAISSGEDDFAETGTWDDGRFSTRVGPHEIFAWQEASEIFASYYCSGGVPAIYALRRLVLD